MARDGVPVGPELAALVARRASGERFDVGSACAAIGVSTSVFYKYLRRFGVEGVAGFQPRSRRPLSSPQRIGAGWEEAIVRARKELADQGWDAGADQIRFKLHDELDPDRLQGPSSPGLPSRATINRVLARRGQLISVPQRRPRRANRRFEAHAPNTRWQMDGFTHALAGGRVATILQLTDDCSRYELGLYAAHSENAAEVWAAFEAAATVYGLPAELLTDNGTAFSGRRRGWVSNLEANLTALGVRHVTSTIRHPQTCGKVERAHQPLQRWLAKHGPYPDLPTLQQALEIYRHHFNHHRRKTHLDGLTPAQRYALGPLDGPHGPPTPALQVKTVHLDRSGKFTIDRISVGIGHRYATQTLTMFRQRNQITLFDHDTYIIDFELDHRHRYQSAHPKTTLSTKS